MLYGLAEFVYPFDSGAARVSPLHWESKRHAGRIRKTEPTVRAGTHEEGLRHSPATGGLPMKLSAPVYHLKRRARDLARKDKLPLSGALDRIAREEGFARWSLLAQKAATVSPAQKLFSRLVPGDLLLLGARPGQGKTLMSLELAVQSMKAGNRAFFFTLEYSGSDVLARFRALDIDLAPFKELLTLDTSDTINAEHIIAALADVPRGTIAVIDYLQLLDQKRENPDLMSQVTALRSFARERGVTFVFITQIDRSYDPSRRACPGLDDVRLPNPLDLRLFDRSCFLHGSEVRFQSVT
ncbi:replicative DNA helicase [Nitratireductor indicus C115]|uniref:Replicative DNA helicase n=2 Tax=Nitratireductor indicus TaxID=721133 RepID=K2PLB2_9HYPH|nr:replicative DNA helicase [Nitratireductor indicus C115]